MTESQTGTAMARCYLRASLAGLAGLRFARDGYARFGAEFLDRMRDVFVLDDAGRIRPLPAPDDDPAFEHAGAEIAAAFLTRRYLGRGMEPAEVEREVMGRARVLAGAWACTPYERGQRLRSWRKGVRGAIRGRAC